MEKHTKRNLQWYKLKQKQRRTRNYSHQLEHTIRETWTIKENHLRVVQLRARIVCSFLYIFILKVKYIYVAALLSTRRVQFGNREAKAEAVRISARAGAVSSFV